MERGALGVFGVVFFLGVSGCGRAPADAGQLVPLAGHVPSEAISRASHVGRAASATPIRLAVALNVRDPEGLEDLIRRQQDPADAEYGHYLTSEEFTASYAPAREDFRKVVSYLRERGLKVTHEHANRLVIEVEGSASEVESVFGVELNEYRKADGRVAYAPSGEPQVPAELAPQLAGVVGLNSFSERVSYHRYPEASAKPPGSGPKGGLAPSEIRAAYGLNKVSQTGKGETLALFELDGYTASDIAAYAKQFGLRNPPALENVLVSGSDGSAGDGAIEVTLDIQLMMAVAPGASKILVYEGPNSDAGGLATYSRIANDNRAREISASWGSPEAQGTPATLQAENAIFMQMAAQGQSMYAASGDSGAYDDGSDLGVDDPASQPYVTGVGGTRLTLGAGAVYRRESAWSAPATAQAAASGGGGGISTVWNIPTWQEGLATASNLGSAEMRMVPDVSLDADPRTGYAVTVNGKWGVVGGTSCAAPIWAAFTALANQERLAAKRPAMGYANPVLYKIAASTKYASAFHDIADGSTNLHYPAARGYDLATGLGTFQGPGLLKALLSAN